MSGPEGLDDAAGTSRQRVSLKPDKCDHCGGVVDESAVEAGACLHCGGPLGPSEAKSLSLVYEDKTMVCLPYELERLAQAEAVDGWRLLDTTVSEAVPGMIEAHFRRPRHLPAASSGPPTPEAADGSGTQPRRARPEHKPPPTAQPDPAADPGLSSEQLRLIVMLGMLVIGVAWAVDQFGIVGFVLAIWLLPQLFRAFSGPGRKRRRRSRRKKKRL